MKGNCSSANPLGCYRGMYLSLWTDHIGQVTFEGETEPYRQILRDPKKEDAVLAFAQYPGANRRRSNARRLHGLA